MEVADSCTMVIFGGSGDLTRHKLIPALYSLHAARRLPERFSILAYARRDMDDLGFRKAMRGSLQSLVSEEQWESFLRRLFYLAGDYKEPEDYIRLREFLSQIDRESGLQGNRIFYLATPPAIYSTVIQQLAGAGMSGRNDSNGSWTRIIIEKPFGSDVETARELNRELHRVFDEKQIYRIDHYLGKETVQNILVFRFGNAVFEPIWNRRYIDHIQITAAEAVGVENRAGYYENAGVIRDMFQNHLLQLLCLAAMEPPVVFTADAVRDEKIKVLRSMKAVSEDEVDQFAVRGQYGTGKVEGEDARAYRDEPGVAPGSTVETYAALKLYIDNWRWQGVPFYLRSGKRLAKRVTEIAIQFKEPPLLLFKPCLIDRVSPNVLLLRIQPDEGIALKFEVKLPGAEVCIESLSLDFTYRQAFGRAPPDAYEALLLDCMRGDSTLFTRHDWVEWAWSLVTPVLQAWEKKQLSTLPNYPAGSWGPDEAELFIQKDGRHWRSP